MLYMIIETFHPGKVKALYARFDEHGRMLPGGVQYINSWIDDEFTRCYQVMETNEPGLLHEWIGHWSDLADFEIVPVFTSSEARERIKNLTTI